MYDHWSEVLLYLERKFGTVWSGQNYQNTYKRWKNCQTISYRGSKGMAHWASKGGITTSYDRMMQQWICFLPSTSPLLIPSVPPFWPPVRNGPAVLSNFGGIFYHFDRSELYQTSFPDVTRLLSNDHIFPLTWAEERKPLLQSCKSLSLAPHTWYRHSWDDLFYIFFLLIWYDIGIPEIIYFTHIPRKDFQECTKGDCDNLWFLI